MPTIYCDNNNAVLLATNPMFHSHSKHIELDLFYVREKVLKKEIFVCHISSENQVADIMTKPLSQSWFCTLRNELKVKVDEEEVVKERG